ncbi:MAG: hypothetical protein M0D55_11255 [Elusimicrobiota bacterium]|nr:MAG: hypothetical protein M0D55_11255 [Elusimicrobiota bacterium]
MIKNTAFLSGSSVAMAALTKLDTTVSFLVDRRQTVAVSPVGKVSSPGYVWRRVFLKGRSNRP